MVHPTNLDAGDGELFNVPVALIPSGGEDPKVMDSIWETLQKKGFGGKCVRRDFVGNFLLLGLAALKYYSWTAIMGLQVRGLITMTLDLRDERGRHMRYSRSSLRRLFE